MIFKKILYIGIVAIENLYEERDLLKQICDSNHLAFRLVFDRYRNKVFSYAIKLLKSDFAAEEVVQEIFISIWLNRRQLPEIQNFGAYIRQISRNQALSALRKNARETVAYALKKQDWQDTDHTTENTVVYKELHNVLQNALNTLPQQQKLIYRQCKLEGMKQSEVAQQLGISVLTVKSHLRMATQSIRAYMDANRDIIFSLIFISVNQILIK